MTTHAVNRALLVRRGRALSWLTLGYNAIEGVVAVISGSLAGSISLVGFGIDSFIEVASGSAALWRLRADVDFARRERVEQQALKIIGASFIGLALYIGIDATKSLWLREKPEESYFGIAIAIGSVIVMPILARAKRKVARGLSSRALAADATQTDLCTYLSVILLGGLGLNALFDWWWADPVAALVMSPIIVHEGIEALRGDHCEDCG